MMTKAMTVLAALLSISMISCASIPIPDDSCSHDIREIHASNPTNVMRIVEMACTHFENETGYVADISKTTVTVEMSEHSRAILSKEPEIYVNHLSETWERELMHEVWHVLLWRNEPDHDVRYHHSRMLEYKLCYPIQLCGYGHGYTAFDD